VRERKERSEKGYDRMDRGGKKMERRGNGEGMRRRE
jgi:hypothetical protein